MSTDTRAGSAHAKVNLGLEILRKRTDGYHEIATVFCPISLSDELTVTSGSGAVELHVDGIDVPSGTPNLCVRAADVLAARNRSRTGAIIRLTKHIPVGAGLGGGSSDAALTLKLLNEVWKSGLSPDELDKLALSLGADVPYFLTGGLSAASGIGEKITPLRVNFPYWIVTVVPAVQVSTAWAYGRVRPRNTHASRLLENFQRSMGDLDSLASLLVNDFEDVVLPEHPQIREVMDLLREAGLRCVRMSGSGAAVYGLTDTEATARSAAAGFSEPFIVSLTPPHLP